MKLSDRILRQALAHTVKRGSLRVTTASNCEFEVGDGTGNVAPLRFHDETAQWLFLADPDVRMGELYMVGRITTLPGRIYDVIFLLLQDYRVRPAPLYLRAIDRFRDGVQRLAQRNTITRSRRNVAHHYDLDVRLYKLFLDEDLQYSCAYFETPTATIEEAQAAKKRHIAAKLLIGAGHRVLDIGCGWGGFAEYLDVTTDASKIIGISLSAEQVAFARTRKRAAASPCRMHFELADYRDIDAKFDRVVSIGMFEHVGLRHYRTFFETCARILEDDGVMLLHTIGCADGPGYLTPWVTKYIFPGGSIPALSQIVAAAEKSRLIVSDVEVLQLHYAFTLREWRQRFLARRDDALALYDERFCRMWEFYLACAEVAFRCEALVVYQVQLTKSPGATPLTRNYIAKGEEALDNQSSDAPPQSSRYRRSAFASLPESVLDPE